MYENKWTTIVYYTIVYYTIVYYTIVYCTSGVQMSIDFPTVNLTTLIRCIYITIQYYSDSYLSREFRMNIIPISNIYWISIFGITAKNTRIVYKSLIIFKYANILLLFKHMLHNSVIKESDTISIRSYQNYSQQL